jgi:pimeloyl-ACP methyl ester carboxylesterase
MLTVREHDIELADGRTLRIYDTLAEDAAEPGLAVFWLHGTPGLGEPPSPLFAAARRRGLRWVSYDRPAYGGSTALPGRDVASAAGDAAAVAEALGLDRFAVLGYSGGGPHALACAALLPDRVVATATLACVAPYGGEGLDIFDGMRPAIAAEFEAAIQGRSELERALKEGEFDPAVFTALDQSVLHGEWAYLDGVTAKVLAAGLDGFLDDDLATVRPWGFDLGAIATPVLLVHGEQDQMVPTGHSRWLAGQVPGAELRLSPGVGHISVLSAEGEAVLEWISLRA